MAPLTFGSNWYAARPEQGVCNFVFKMSTSFSVKKNTKVLLTFALIHNFANVFSSGALLESLRKD
jgi:hypothetical protein